MSYFLFLLIPIVLSALYLIVVLMEVPGFAEERLGRFLRKKGLPEDINRWKPDPDSTNAANDDDDTLLRETRIYRDPAAGWFGRGRLYWQVRYIDRTTGEVIRTEPDRPIRRFSRRIAR